MIDHKILPIQHLLLAPIARRLTLCKITANQLTMIGLVLGLLAFMAISKGFFILGLLLILSNRVIDGLDGMVARNHGSTDRGAYLDSVFDFAFYALIPLAFAINDPACALAISCLLASFLGTGSAFLAFAIIAEKRQLKADNFPKKGFYYLGGLAEGFETILTFVLMCLLPSFCSTIAIIFAFLCLVTTLARWYFVWQLLET